MTAIATRAAHGSVSQPGDGRPVSRVSTASGPYSGLSSHAQSSAHEMSGMMVGR